MIFLKKEKASTYGLSEAGKMLLYVYSLYSLLAMQVHKNRNA